MKKGVFFTIDAILASGIIVSVILFASSLYLKEQPTVHLNYLSRDIIRTLSALTVEEIDNVYVNERIANGDIEDMDNTVLEQIAEFWAAGTEEGMEFANKTTSNVTALWVPENMGFGLWTDNEAVYTRDIPIERSLVSSKKIMSGIEKGEAGGLTRKNPPILLGPVVIEVRVWQ